MISSRWLLVLALAVGFMNSAWGQIGISPRTLDVVLDKDGRSHSFKLFNLTDKPFRVSVSVANWTFDQENKVQIIPPTPESLDQWMVINPLKFEIPAGESQTIRVGFRPQQELMEGEYRALVYFDQELSPDEKPEVKQLRSRLRIGAAVYAHVGEVRPAAQLENVRIEGDEVALDIANHGNTHVRLDGQWSVWSAMTYPGAETTTQIVGLGREGAVLPTGVVSADYLPRTPVLPGERRTLKFKLNDLPSEAAALVLDMDAQFSNKVLDRAEPFAWAGHASTTALQQK